MHGIISKEPLSPSLAQADGVAVLSPFPWLILCGEDAFEDGAVAVIADSVLCHRAELSDLAGETTGSDARIVGALYLKYGTQIFEKLEGQFSIGIFDKRSRTLIIATDRFGIKPVAYYHDNRYFAFGSRIKDVLATPGIKAGELDHEALVDYLNLSAIPTPKTVYRGIRKLPPGHFIIFNHGDTGNAGLVIRKYYDIDYARNRSGESHFLRELPRSMETSVKTILDAELAAGRSVGAFLSGGTDSSTVTGMIKKLAGSVKTFSIGFDEPGYNELGYARIAARHFGAEHYEYIVTPEDVLDALDLISDVYDEPFGNASAVPTYYCAKLAREHGVDTLLAGDGGDEIFGGNERYAADKVFSNYHRIPALVRKGLLEPVMAAAPAGLPVVNKGKKYIRRANIPQPDRFFSYNPVMALGQENIFSPDFIGHLGNYDPVAWARELYRSTKGANDLDRLMYIDMKFTITDNDIRKVSGMAGKAGIHVAYPFLDHALVDFAATIPSDLRVKGKTLRYIFKEAFKDFLPHDVIVKKKHGFGLPIGVWIRTKKNIADFVGDALLTSHCTIRPFFRDGFIEELFRIHRETGAAFYGDIIWNLLILELWNKRRLVG